MSETQTVLLHDTFPGSLSTELDELFMGAADKDNGLITGVSCYLPNESGNLVKEDAKCVIGDVLLSRANSDELYQLLKLAELDSEGAQRTMFVLRRLCVISGSRLEFIKGYFVVIDVTNQLAAQITYNFDKESASERAEYDHLEPVTGLDGYEELSGFVRSMQPLSPSADRAKLVVRENKIVDSYLDASEKMRKKTFVARLLGSLARY